MLAPLALFCIWAGGAPFGLLIVAAALAMAHEWLGLCRVPSLSPPAVIGMAAVGAAVALSAFGEVLAALAVLALGIAAAGLGSRRAALALGAAYVGLPMIALVWLRDGVSPAGRDNVFFLVLVIWASDIGAYAAGRLLRGPRYR